MEKLHKSHVQKTVKALCRSLICKCIMLSRFNTNSTILSVINISWPSRANMDLGLTVKTT